MDIPHAPVPEEGFVVTHFLTVEDQARSREFYAGVLGGEVLTQENPCIIKLANSWIILNSGGGPTPDKPEVFLEPPQEPFLFEVRCEIEALEDFGAPLLDETVETGEGKPVALDHFETEEGEHEEKAEGDGHPPPEGGEKAAVR